MKVTVPFTSKVPKATLAEVQNANATVTNKYVSPYILKEWFAWVRGFSWVWIKKQTFSEGFNIGNNPTPTNGDIWFNGTNFLARSGNANGVVLTSNTSGGLGRVFYVSDTSGNNDTGTMGRQDLPYKTIQRAFNDASSGDQIKIQNGTYPEHATTNKALNIVLENATVQKITMTLANNAKIEGVGRSTVTTLSWGDDRSGNGHGYFENITIGTWESGYRGTCNFFRCIIGNFVAGASDVQNWKAKNCTLSNITTNSLGNVIFSRADFYDCTLNNCSFQGISTYAIFTLCRLNSCTFNHYTPRILFSYCKAKSTTFNFSYSGAMPNAHCLFVADNTTFAGFTLNNNTSSLTQTIVFTLQNVITDKDFNTLLASNITYDLLDQHLVSTATANKFIP